MVEADEVDTPKVTLLVDVDVLHNEIIEPLVVRNTEVDEVDIEVLDANEQLCLIDDELDYAAIYLEHINDMLLDDEVEVVEVIAHLVEDDVVELIDEPDMMLLVIEVDDEVVDIRIGADVCVYDEVDINEYL